MAKKKVILSVAFTGEDIEIGNKIENYLSKQKGERGIGYRSPKSNILKRWIIAGYENDINSYSEPYRPQYVKELEIDEKGNKTEAQKTEAESKAKVVKSYYFTNVKYPNIVCNMCGKTLLNQLVVGQLYEDGSKTYICSECEVDAESDRTIYSQKKKLHEIRKALREADRELNKKINEEIELDERLEKKKVIENLFETFCRIHKEGNLKPEEYRLLEEAIPILREIRDTQKDLKDMAFEKYVRKEPQRNLERTENYQPLKIYKSESKINLKEDYVKDDFELYCPLERKLYERINDLKERCNLCNESYRRYCVEIKEEWRKEGKQISDII